MTTKFSVGTRVRVRHDMSTKTDTTRAGYNKELDKYKGKIFTISLIGDDFGNLQFEEDEVKWWFSPTWLEPHQDDFFEKELFEL